MASSSNKRTAPTLAAAAHPKAHSRHCWKAEARHDHLVCPATNHQQPACRLDNCLQNVKPVHIPGSRSVATFACDRVLKEAPAAAMRVEVVEESKALELFAPSKSQGTVLAWARGKPVAANEQGSRELGAANTHVECAHESSESLKRVTLAEGHAVHKEQMDLQQQPDEMQHIQRTSALRICLIMAVAQRLQCAFTNWYVTAATTQFSALPAVDAAPLTPPPDSRQGGLESVVAGVALRAPFAVALEAPFRNGWTGGANPWEGEGRSTKAFAIDRQLGEQSPRAHGGLRGRVGQARRDGLSEPHPVPDFVRVWQPRARNLSLRGAASVPSYYVSAAIDASSWDSSKVPVGPAPPRHARQARRDGIVLDMPMHRVGAKWPLVKPPRLRMLGRLLENGRTQIPCS